MTTFLGSSQTIDFAMKTMVSSFYAVLALNLGVTFALEKPCGDWEPFKDEKCFKVFDSIGFKNFTDAEATCAAHDSGKLISITFKEEQDFLANYLFKQKQVVDTVWLGAKVTGGVFHWEDGTNLTFTNWASGEPRNQADHCAQMNPEGETAGKWMEMSCKKKNLVVCQKEQLLSLAKMHAMLFQIRKDLAASERTFQEEISQLKANTVPLGFIYVQFPKEKSPAVIWPSMSWTDVTSAYAGVFFRAEGGGAGSFGTIQEENVPTIDKVKAEGCSLLSTGECHDDTTQFTFSPYLSLPKTTGWSGYVGSNTVWATSNTGGYHNLFLHQYHNSGGEVRPRNMAIKVWKRSA